MGARGRSRPGDSLAVLMIALCLHLAALYALIRWSPAPPAAERAAGPGADLDLEIAGVELLGDLPVQLPAASAGAGDRHGHQGGARRTGIVDAAGEPGAGSGRADGDPIAGPRHGSRTLRRRPRSAAFHRSPRLRRRPGDSSPEALVREPDPGRDNRPPRARGSTGDPEPRPGQPADGGGAEQSDARSPRSGAAAAAGDESIRIPKSAGARGAPLERRGMRRHQPEKQLADPGPAATESAHRGPVREEHSGSAASSARNSDPFELARGEGVRGMRTGRGGVRGSGAAGAGRGSQRRGGGTAGGMIEASRDDPYFRRLFEAIDGEVRYPRELALSLQGGTVIVFLSVGADGRLRSLTIARRSGHAELDRALTAAIRRAQPFPPPPARWLRGRGSLRVRMPFSFRSPMIR